MIELTARVSSKNQITLPAAVRRRLGVGAFNNVAFVLSEEGGVEIRRARFDLASVLGSVPPLPWVSADFDLEIAEAIAEEVARRSPLST
jgi:AbrB family looped-hinge helix DNA binding protein